MSALQLDSGGVLTACGSCGKTNRLPYSGLNKLTRCGHCHSNLPSPATPIEVASAAAFEAALSASSLPIVVDFWAPWCAPCRMVAPELETVARSAAGELLLVKINTENLPALGDRFGVRSIPTLAVFRDGREVARTAGARPAADILAFVRQATLHRAS